MECNSSPGSIRGCIALDTTSGGPCLWVAMGCHSFNWGHMDCCVSSCFDSSSHILTRFPNCCNCFRRYTSFLYEFLAA